MELLLCELFIEHYDNDSLFCDGYPNTSLFVL